MKLVPRYYQQEAVDIVKAKGPGNWLIVACTSAGKSLMMSMFERKGKLLILVNRENLMHSNAEYFDCEVGFEQAERTSNGEEVVIASVQSMFNRLDKFDPNEFDVVCVDEAHNYTAKEYRKIVQYFKPRQRIGLTATPNRSDGVGLDCLFDEIVYEIGIEQLMREGYICRVKCFKVNVGYDLSGVTSRMGDFSISELEKQVNIAGSQKAIKEIVDKYDGSYIIACTNVKHAEEVAEFLGGVAVTGETKNREQILSDYKKGKITILTTVNVLSEGSNLPIAKNLIMASPTQSIVKFIQICGRVMRLHPSKTECRIFDLVGNTGKHSICGAHTLLGLDIESVPKSDQIELEGDLLDELPQLIKRKSDSPLSWIKNMSIMNIFAKKNDFNTHKVNYFLHPDQSMICSLPEGRWIGITKTDKLGNSTIITSKGKTYEKAKTQENLDRILRLLKAHEKKTAPIWNSASAKRWGKEPSGIKQRGYANALLRAGGFDYCVTDSHTKADVGCIISRLKKNDIQSPQRKCAKHNERSKIRFNFGPSGN